MEGLWGWFEWLNRGECCLDFIDDEREAEYMEEDNTKKEERYALVALVTASFFVGFLLERLITCLNLAAEDQPLDLVH